MKYYKFLNMRITFSNITESFKINDTLYAMDNKVFFGLKQNLISAEEYHKAKKLLLIV